MKKRYAKPRVESETVFEALAAGCGLQNPNDDSNCDSDWGGQTYLTLGGWDTD